ncbi:TadE/TadG family type IV pilus assembly protein [Allokutzneria albata]|uniref:TadE-like protein n=1 Tax=Allokutzneria albata TaxID=211114 RepID=A0A1G9Y9U1_ALLAB|nr:TadE/TadG family type IV pilus assembly protein [Allokutzneria albata]SDN05848.1 TadE-like protein [Allokutzneria albata]
MRSRSTARQGLTPALVDVAVTQRSPSVLRRWLAEDTGSASVELVLLAPLAVLLVLFLVLCGRVVDARMLLADAAHQAARAGSLARTAPDAHTAARAVADRALSDSRLRCRGSTVTVDTTGFRPGGAITVTLTCPVDVADLTSLSIPGRIGLTSHASSPLDRYRATTGGDRP